MFPVGSARWRRVSLLKNLIWYNQDFRLHAKGRLLFPFAPPLPTLLSMAGDRHVIWESRIAHWLLPFCSLFHWLCRGLDEGMGRREESQIYKHRNVSSHSSVLRWQMFKPILWTVDVSWVLRSSPAGLLHSEPQGADYAFYSCSCCFLLSPGVFISPLYTDIFFGIHTLSEF